MNTKPPKNSKKDTFEKTKNHQKSTQKNIFYLKNLNVFEYNRFIELLCCKIIFFYF